MTTTLTFDGGTALLGRDGWCQLSHAQVDTMTEYGECIITLYDRSTSTAIGAMLHIYNPEELRILICGLAKALAQMLAPGRAPGTTKEHV